MSDIDIPPGGRKPPQIVLLGRDVGIFFASLIFTILAVGTPAVALAARAYLAWLAWHYAGAFAPTPVMVALVAGGGFALWVHIGGKKPRMLSVVVDCLLATLACGALAGWGVFPRLAPAYAAWTLSGAAYYGGFAAAASVTQWDKVIDWHKRRKLEMLGGGAPLPGVVAPPSDGVSNPEAEDGK